MKIGPKHVVYNYQCIEKSPKLDESQVYSAHELGAHENLDGFRRAVEDGSGELKVIHRIQRHTEAPLKTVNSWLKGTAVTGLMASLAFPALGLGAAALAGAGLLWAARKAKKAPLSIKNIGRGEHKFETSFSQTRGATTGKSPLNNSSISQDLIAQMKSYPEARHMVQISGHGGSQYSAGLSFEALGKELQRAVLQGGKAIDVVVFKSCSTGQLENLVSLIGGAKTAVTSSEPILSFHFPTREIYAQAKLSGSPQKVASKMAEELQDSLSAKNARSVDLEKLEALLPSLEQLGHELQTEIGRGRKFQLMKCMARATVESPNSGGDLLRFDLMRTLKSLSSAQDLSETTRRAAKHCLQNQPFLDKPKDDTLSMSFHLKPENAAMRKRLPQWSAFTDHFRAALLKNALSGASEDK